MINATLSIALELHCLNNSICNDMSIYTPISPQTQLQSQSQSQSQSSSNDSDEDGNDTSNSFLCSIIVHNAYMTNLSIYTYNGFNDTNINITTKPISSRLPPSSSSSTLGTMHCGPNFNQSCPINITTSNCINPFSSKCASYPNPTRSPSSYDNDIASGVVLAYVSIGVGLVITCICCIMCITYFNTRDKYSGRLKPRAHHMTITYNIQLTKVHHI